MYSGSDQSGFVCPRASRNGYFCRVRGAGFAIATVFSDSVPEGLVSRLRSLSLFVSLALIWGVMFPAIAVGLEDLPPVLFAALRYDVGLVPLLAYTVVRTDDWRPTSRDDFEAVLGSGLFLFGGTGLLFVGQQTVPSGVAAMLQSLVPIVTALWAFLLLGERLSVGGALGVGFAVVGVGFIVQPDPDNLLAGDTVGRLIILGQVTGVALGTVWLQRVEPDIGRVPMTGWGMAVGAAVLHAVSFGLGEAPDAGAATPAAIGAVLYIGVFGTALAFLLYFAMIERQGAFETTLIGYVVPIVATVVGVFVLGERISPLTLLGFGLVVAGFGVLKRRAIAELTGLATGGA